MGHRELIAQVVTRRRGGEKEVRESERLTKIIQIRNLESRVK